MEEISIKNRLELMNVLPSEACGEVFTRADVANNVLKLLKAKPGVFSNPNYRFLDIYTKSGVFLLLIYSELMQGLVEAIPDPEIRSQHILGKMIYGISPSVETALISRKTLYGGWSTQGNIKVITGYKNDTGKRTFSNISKEFNGMKFDVVIGNPPYNNDMYLDFVTLGDQLATKYTCMITPAKWQAKGGEKNEAFRKNIVPRMSDIVFYPNEKDVFDIHILGGLTYFIIDKEQHDTKLVTNISNGKTATDKISFLNGDIILDVKCACIISKVLQSPGYSSITKSKDFIPQKSYFCNKQPSEILPDENGHFYLKNQTNFMKISDSYIKHIEEARQYKVYCGYNVNPVPLAHIYEPNEVANRVSCLMGFGSLDKCNSIKSYYETRFIWFLAYVASTGTICTDTFKWVPDPGKFDHIFTDEELYKKYNLTPEEIAIIESVIKERKQGDK